MSNSTPSQSVHPTLWGLSPLQLHDRFWAACGVQVVRRGDSSSDIGPAALFLLVEPRTLPVFCPGVLRRALDRSRSDLLLLRLLSSSVESCRERPIVDRQGQLTAVRRTYEPARIRPRRITLTDDPLAARLWQFAQDRRSAWRLLRLKARRGRPAVVTIRGRVFDASNDGELATMAQDLLRCWSCPRATVPGVNQMAPGIWGFGQPTLAPHNKIVPPIWVGAGRSLQETDHILGPVILWDHPAAAPTPPPFVWPKTPPNPADDPESRASIDPHPGWGKRLFDIVFATVALALTLPFYPLVMLAIWLEDGRPFFFGHRRETRGGKEFSCLKFRSMRKDADVIKKQLAQRNQVDGPQFYIQQDPRLTRVGKILRKLNIDELPQFINVLVGQMSVVGPRPSPYSENQLCVPWREARLSVRPGITGLWQVRRTRRKGLDFQEWIEYDLRYVRDRSMGMDLRIIWETILTCLPIHRWLRRRTQPVAQPARSMELSNQPSPS